MKYLVSKYKLPDHWYPADLKRQVKIDEYLHWHHGNLRVGAAHTIFNKVCLVLVRSLSCLASVHVRLLFL